MSVYCSLPVKDIDLPHATPAINREQRINTVVMSILEHGYDDQRPVLVVLYRGRYVLAEGRVRYLAAIDCGFDKVPVRLVTLREHGDMIERAYAV